VHGFPEVGQARSRQKSISRLCSCIHSSARFAWIHPMEPFEKPVCAVCDASFCLRTSAILILNRIPYYWSRPAVTVIRFFAESASPSDASCSRKQGSTQEWFRPNAIGQRFKGHCHGRGRPDHSRRRFSSLGRVGFPDKWRFRCRPMRNGATPGSEKLSR
jgi:hypothetical protein